MERRVLNENELTNAIADLSGWKTENNALYKRFELADFITALDLVNKAAVIANEMDHHPDIEFGWGYAAFSITTHDRGGITDLDLLLARKFEEIK